MNPSQSQFPNGSGADRRQSEVEEHITSSEADTARLGMQFAERLTPGEWVGLIGPLGAGKSVFARAVGRAWGVSEVMPSPSYTLMNTYDGSHPVFHIDLYRVGSPDELDFADLSQYFAGCGICLVEWAEKIPSRWPTWGWAVTFAVIGSDKRRIRISRLQPGR